MKNLITITFCLFVSCAAIAQKRNVYFLKNDGSQTELRENADYTRIISSIDSGSTLFNVVEIYKNGKKKLTGRSSSIDNPIFEGKVITFYPTGARQNIENYSHGVLSGEVYTYFTNGQLDKVKLYNSSNTDDDVSGLVAYKIITSNDSTGKSLVTDGNGYYTGYEDRVNYIDELKSIVIEGAVKNGARDGVWKGTIEGNGTFTEIYKGGKLKSGILTEVDGTIYKYSKRLVSPAYPGSEKFFGEFLSDNVKYPPYARERRIQGDVGVGFIVKKDGVLEDIQIVKSVHESIDNEALRVMKLSKKWIAAKYFGKPVDIRFTFPINFNISFTSTSVAQGDRKRVWPGMQ